MEKLPKPSNSECYTPSSEPFKIEMDCYSIDHYWSVIGEVRILTRYVNIWAPSAPPVKFLLKIPPKQFYLGKLSPQIAELQVNGQPFSRKSPFFFMGPVWRVPILELECLYSSSTDVWMNSWMPDMNKIRKTVPEQARRSTVHPSVRQSIHPTLCSSIHPSIPPSFHPSLHTYIHTYIHTYRWYTGNHFFTFRGAENV
jgi:hypothetical protein